MFWTPQEADKLRALWPSGDWGEMCSALGKTIPTIRHKAKQLGLPSPVKGSWTPDRTEILRNLWPVRSPADVAKALGISVDAVRNKARRIGLPPTGNRPARVDAWSKTEIKKATELKAEGLSAADISTQMNRSRCSILGMFFRNRVKTAKANKTAKLKPNVAVFRKQEERPPVGKEVSLHNRQHAQCAYLIHGHTCCGEETFYNSSWCKYHYTRVYVRKDAA